MNIEIKTPTFPQTIEYGTLCNIWVQAGQETRCDDVLFEIETDKIILEVVAPADGKIVEYLIREGEDVHSEQIIAIFEESDVSLPKQEDSPPQHQHPSQHQRPPQHPHPPQTKNHIPPPIPSNVASPETHNIKLIVGLSFFAGTLFGALICIISMLMMSTLG